MHWPTSAFTNFKDHSVSLVWPTWWLHEASGLMLMLLCLKYSPEREPKNIGCFRVSLQLACCYHYCSPPAHIPTWKHYAMAVEIRLHCQKKRMRTTTRSCCTLLSGRLIFMEFDNGLVDNKPAMLKSQSITTAGTQEGFLSASPVVSPSSQGNSPKHIEYKHAHIEICRTIEPSH